MKLNFSGKIAKFFLYNRPLAILILFSTVLFGVGAYILTPKQYNPTIELPAFQIIVDFPGATAEETERFITQELEEKISDIDGVDKIFSQSMEGRSIVNVQFNVGESTSDSKIKIKQKVEENQDLLVFAMTPPIIKNIDPDSVPILTLGFSSNKLNQNQIRPLVLEIMNDLRKVKDVANLDVHGGETRSLNIILDPTRLQARNVTIEMVKQAFQSANLKSFVGNIKNGQTLHGIKIDGTVLSPIEAEKIFIAPGIQLRDVAELKDAYQEKNSFVEVLSTNDKRVLTSSDTVFLSLAKKEGSNAIEVADDVFERLSQKLKNSRYQNLTLETFRNDAAVAQKTISNLLNSLFTSVIIVSFVLLIFLGFRSAMLVAITIPLTLSTVFLFGFIADEVINRITLFALILSLGLLVDNATVVVENIYRHFHKNQKDKKDAIVEAVNEVGTGLFISTLTSVIVFLPTAYITGMMGEYMGPLSFFVPLALVISLVIAYVLTPFLADVMLPNEVPQEFKKKDFFDKLSDKYAVFLGKILKNKTYKRNFLRAVFGLMVVVMMFPVFRFVHFKMLPSANKEQFYITIDAPEGTDLAATKKIADEVSAKVLKNLEVVSVQSFVGEPAVVDFNGLFRGSNLRQARHLATLKVNLTQPEDRNISSSKLVRSLRAELKQSADKLLPNTVVKFVEDPPGPPVRATLEAKIKGSDRKVLTQVASDLARIFKQENKVEDIDTSIESSVYRTVYKVDHEKAMSAGISTFQIINTLKSLLGETPIGQYQLQNQYEILMADLVFSSDKKDQIQDLSEVFLKNQQGQMVPLESLVIASQSRQDGVLFTDQQEPTVYVTAEMGNRSVVYAVIDIIPKILNYEFPNQGKLVSWNLFGFTFETIDKDLYEIEWGGEWKMTLENFRDLGLAMLVAFFLIYMVLVAQFESFTVPLLIMTTMPLSFLGIMPGFAILDLGWGTFLTATSLIGFIALMGIVVNNAIIYLEYFYVLLDKGVEFQTALVKAGKNRLRPILLTSATTILGNLTIVTDPVWSGLAWSIVFGLSISSILTLGVFPLLYDTFRPKRHD